MKQPNQQKKAYCITDIDKFILIKYTLVLQFGLGPQNSYKIDKQNFGILYVLY